MGQNGCGSESGCALLVIIFLIIFYERLCELHFYGAERLRYGKGEDEMAEWVGLVCRLSYYLEKYECWKRRKWWRILVLSWFVRMNYIHGRL
jgi:hypothetical protein